MAKVYLTDNDRRSAQLRALMAKYQSLRNVKSEDLAIRLGMSRPTLIRKKRDASRFTLGELLGLARTLNIPRDELLDALDPEGGTAYENAAS